MNQDEDPVRVVYYHRQRQTRSSLIDNENFGEIFFYPHIFPPQETDTHGDVQLEHGVVLHPLRHPRQRQRRNPEWPPSRLHRDLTVLVCDSSLRTLGPHRRELFGALSQRFECVEAFQKYSVP